MECSYKTKGTCSRKIDFEINGDKLGKVRFLGGCHGNLQGIAKLVEGMAIDDVITRLENIKCGDKATSCPDQLAKALKEAKDNIEA
ncbi:MAG: TIGR03905 family TSCPD domain-containing protein [Bacillota bacterium]|nr:TIGR03905 family TSCPD domain-containing protein [Bacillota bacterium]